MPTPYGTIGPEYQEPHEFDWTEYLANAQGVAEEYRRQGLRFPESLRLPPGVFERVEARNAATIRAGISEPVLQYGVFAPTQPAAVPSDAGPSASSGEVHLADRGPADAPAADPAGGPECHYIGDDSPSGGDRSLLGAASAASSDDSFQTVVPTNMFETMQDC